MQIVSLFSGAGGLDLGLIQAGHTVVWAVDSDTDSCATYKANIGSHILNSDIERVRTETLPACDIVVGGFPCQGFSQANLLRSTKDDRNKLYKHFLRVLRDVTPKWFLAENVKGILSLDNGKALNRIISDFQSCGYHVEYRLFNTADYGVPQIRQRVIIAGTRSDIGSDFRYRFPKATHSNKSAQGLLPWVTVSTALSHLPDPDKTHDLANHIYSRYKVTNRNFTGHRRTDPEKPCPTILARGNGGGGVCAIQHPANTRRMSVREQATIQTFPETFRFFGAMNSCYRQVGNAVPVLFAKHLGLGFG